VVGEGEEHRDAKPMMKDAVDGPSSRNTWLARVGEFGLARRGFRKRLT